MFTQHVVLPEPIGTSGYGYGWELWDVAGRRGVGHLGNIDGFNGIIDRFPGDKTTVILLANLEWPSVNNGVISRQLSGMILDQ